MTLLFLTQTVRGQPSGKKKNPWQETACPRGTRQLTQTAELLHLARCQHVHILVVSKSLVSHLQPAASRLVLKVAQVPISPEHKPRLGHRNPSTLKTPRTVEPAGRPAKTCILFSGLPSSPPSPLPPSLAPYQGERAKSES